MKKAVKIIGLAITLLTCVCYLLSCFTPYVSPQKISFATILSIGYLPLLLFYFLLMVIWFFIRKKMALLLFIFLFAGYKNLVATIGTNVLHNAWKWKKDSSTLRMMCWNVKGLGDPYIDHDSISPIRKNMLQFIEEMQPDILCVQDFSSIEEGRILPTFYNNTNDVMKRGNFSYIYYPFYYEHNGTNYCVKAGVAVFSKYPITDTGSFKTGGAIPEERAGYADILFNKKIFRIYTAHLSSMGLWPNNADEGGLKFIEGDSTKTRTRTIVSKLSFYGKVHARQADAIKKQLDASPHPFLFSGDLNSVPSSYVYHTLKKGLQDAFLENDFGIGGTYNLVFPKLRIDVLLHSKEIEVVQYHRPVTDLSDHYPILADIRFKK